MERFPAGHRLLRMEPAAVREFTGDRGVVTGDRVHILHRGVGAVRHHRAAVEERAPGVSAFAGTPFAEFLRHPGAVRSGVDRLHRGDHAQFAEPGDVGRVDVLRVFDAEAEVSSVHARFGEAALVEVEDLPVAPVADGVGVHLETVADGEADGLFDVLEFLEDETLARGHVVVRREQPGAVRAERAVHLPLDGADGEEPVGVVLQEGFGEAGVHLFVRLPAHHHIEPDREPPGFRHLPEEGDGLERGAGVLETGDALAQRFFGGEFELEFPLGADFGVAPFGEGAVARAGDQALGGFPQRAGGPAVGAADDRAAGRVGRFIGDPGEFHGERVGEGSVAAGVAEEHRVLRGDLGEAEVVRQPFHRAGRDFVPLLLVPAAAFDPRAGRGFGHGFGDEIHDAVPVLRFAQLQDHLRVADAHEVAVALDEPGDGQPAVEFDHFGVRADIPLDVAGGADGGDPVAADGQRFAFRNRVVHGDDPAAEEHQVGGPAFRRRPAPAGGQRGEGEESGGESGRSGAGEEHGRGVRARWEVGRAGGPVRERRVGGPYSERGAGKYRPLTARAGGGRRRPVVGALGPNGNGLGGAGSEGGERSEGAAQGAPDSVPPEAASFSAAACAARCRIALSTSPRTSGSIPLLRTLAANASGVSSTNSLPMSSSAKLLETRAIPSQSSSSGFSGAASRRFRHFVRNSRPAHRVPNPDDSPLSRSTMASPSSVS